MSNHKKLIAIMIKAARGGKLTPAEIELFLKNERLKH